MFLLPVSRCTLGSILKCNSSEFLTYPTNKIDHKVVYGIICAAIVRIHKQLSITVPLLLTMIAPRQPNRGQFIATVSTHVSRFIAEVAYTRMQYMNVMRIGKDVHLNTVFQLSCFK